MTSLEDIKNENVDLVSSSVSLTLFLYVSLFCCQTFVVIVNEMCLLCRRKYPLMKCFES